MLKFLLFIFLFYSCSPKATPLSNTYNSKEEVISNAFEFLTKGDEASLDGMLLTREEHNNNFWNFVGERFRSDPGMSADLAYEHMSIETYYAKKQLIHDLNGKFLSIKRISCPRVENYNPFKLHLGCKVLANTPTGSEIEINGIRTVIELNGKYKLYHLKRE